MKQKAHLVNFLLSDALALILSRANLDIINWKAIFHVRYLSVFYLFSWLVTVLDEGRPADCNSHVLGSLPVLDEAVLNVVLLTVFFLQSHNVAIYC